MSTHWYLALLIAVALERLFEMRLSDRNAKLAFAQGGLEFGQRHFIFMKGLHTALLLGAALEVLLLHRPFIPELGFPMLGLALAAQSLRYWAVSSLGTRWNVRVIVIPGAPAIRRGPYQYMRHPNYVAVVLEGIALPLIHSAWITACVFSVLNAGLLWIRISCEERSLREHTNYDESFGTIHRFWPRQEIEELE